MEIEWINRQDERFLEANRLAKEVIEQNGFVRIGENGKLWEEKKWKSTMEERINHE